ncbi:MAG: TetR/AcrR family transcriptional regulator [Candidatus Sericytochromatia bacterium]|nr:TetR/AcrR family transcriptional regulator [Candidatus Sericytochromatia bacterium]
MANLENRQKILAAAQGLFFKQGYHGTTLRDIGRDAHVSMGGIYHHFDSKEAIYLSLLETASQAFDFSGLLCLLTDAAFPHNLAEVGRFIAKAIRANKPFFKLSYVDILEFQGRHMRFTIDTLRHTIAQVTQGALQTQMASGRMRSLHPAIVTRVILDIYLHYFLEEAMLDKSLADQIGVSEDDLIGQMEQILLFGVMTPTAGDTAAAASPASFAARN